MSDWAEPGSRDGCGVDEQQRGRSMTDIERLRAEVRAQSRGNERQRKYIERLLDELTALRAVAEAAEEWAKDFSDGEGNVDWGDDRNRVLGEALAAWRNVRINAADNL